jgi:hypothetical protein
MEVRTKLAYVAMLGLGWFLFVGLIYGILQLRHRFLP